MGRDRDERRNRDEREDRGRDERDTRRRRSRSRSRERRRERSDRHQDRDRGTDVNRDRERRGERAERSVREVDRERPAERERRRESPPASSHSSRPKAEGCTKSKIDIESVDVTEDEMMKSMGFGGFDTTKNKHVKGNIDGIAKVNKARKYRQYMNRKGGFNRPLDYIA